MGRYYSTPTLDRLMVDTISAGDFATLDTDRLHRAFDRARLTAWRLDTDLERERLRPKRLEAQGVAMRTREGGDRESWHKRARLRLVDVERHLGRDLPTAECERLSEHTWYACSTSSRYQCDACAERESWDQGALDLVSEATGWGLWTWGCNSAHMTGRGFADMPSVYVLKDRPGVLRVSHGGGLDV